jgi:hypothetical protein
LTTAKLKHGLTAEEWQAAKEDLRQICIQTARDRAIITYGEVAARMTTVAAHPGAYVFQNLLREMCRDEEAAGRGMLCALVVQKASGKPGAGFYKAIVQLRAACADDLEACWQRECERVYAVWADV